MLSMLPLSHTISLVAELSKDSIQLHLSISIFFKLNAVLNPETRFTEIGKTAAISFAILVLETGS